jgi:rubrerythrin
MPKDWLRSLIGDEQDAQREYASAAKDARKSGDKASAKLFDHIRPEEREHERELTARMRGKGFMGKAA